MSRRPGRMRAGAIAGALLLSAGLLPGGLPVATAQVPRTITIEAPGAGASVISPVAVQGRVTVAPFENNLVGRVFDGAGGLVGEGPVPVTAPGLGQPGTFSGSIPFSVSGFTPGRVEIEDVNASGGPPFATASVQVNLDTLGPAWLDQAAPVNWNGPRNPLPVAPPPPSAAPPDPRCLETLRPPETAEDQQVSAAGWGLVGQFTGGWGLRIVAGQSGFDGMCRPLSYQVFVFSGGTYAGTMSPGPMDARTDGAWQQAQIFSGGQSLSATFARYRFEDPLCCPSGSSVVTYNLDRSGEAPVLVAQNTVTTYQEPASP
jgi:LppP/LprE lipoprotein/Immunoglobulin-like domain of bacterial spore germination